MKTSTAKSTEGKSERNGQLREDDRGRSRGLPGYQGPRPAPGGQRE